jgi:hypothetical protein
LVEHDLAKVGVAGSSPVFRSTIPHQRDFFYSPGGGIGRHAGLKILWPAMAVTVQLRSGAQHLFNLYKTENKGIKRRLRIVAFFICCQTADEN